MAADDMPGRNAASAASSAAAAAFFAAAFAAFAWRVMAENITAAVSR